MKLCLRHLLIFILVVIITSMLGCDVDRPEETIDIPDESAADEPEPEPEYTEVETLADFAQWETAAEVWAFFCSSEVAEEATIIEANGTISFNLPVHDKHYYMYTFEGTPWELAPTNWDNAFGNLQNYDAIKIEFDYTLESELTSFQLFFGQHDETERILTESWDMPVTVGNSSFSQYVKLEPDAEIYRVYLRFVNPEAENRIDLNSLTIIGCMEQ